MQSYGVLCYLYDVLCYFLMHMTRQFIRDAYALLVPPFWLKTRSLGAVRAVLKVLACLLLLLLLGVMGLGI